MRFQLSPLARLDMKEIWRYSRDHWGRAKADIYIRDINALMSRLASHPDRGRSVDDIRTDYFRASIESHAVFYRRAETGIFVIRILHQSMDFQRHL